MAERTEVEQWRYKHSSAIRNMLGLSRTSYLNVTQGATKRKNCQRILAEIRATRPPL